MLLVTAPIEQIWPENESVLLLGEWCRVSETRNRSPGAPVVPYHWDDRALLERDFHDVEALVERLLPALAERLNALHGLAHPVRYWRLVAGWWLKMYLAVLLDRIRVVEAALSGGDATRAIALPGDEYSTVPVSKAHFMLCAGSSDEWNHHVFVQLLSRRGGIAIERLPGEPARSEGFAPVVWQRGGRLRDLSRRAVAKLAELGGRSARVALIDVYLPPKQVAKLNLALGQFPATLSPRIPVAVGGIDRAARATLALDQGDGFERVAGQMIPYFIPRSLVEEFAALRKQGTRRLPRAPRVIVTAQFPTSDDAASIWAAEKREKGARLTVLQHGGHIGVDRWEQSETFEISVADRYYTWGWDVPGRPQIVPMPAPKLSVMGNLRPDREGPALFVYDGLPRYGYRMFCIPVAAGQRAAYRDQQVSLIESLPEPMRAQCRLRLNPAGSLYRCDLAETFEGRGWGELISPPSDPMGKVLTESRIAVVTVNATSYLETFALDYPTLLYLDPVMWAVRDEAKPYFDQLREAGILWDRPEDAAAHLARIWDDVPGWWHSPAVQAARLAFVDRFARRAPDWMDQWVRELTAL